MLLLGKTVRPRPSSYAAWAWRELECALSLRWGPADWSACTWTYAECPGGLHSHLASCREQGK